MLSKKLNSTTYKVHGFAHYENYQTIIIVFFQYMFLSKFSQVFYHCYLLFTTYDCLFAKEQ